MYTKEKHNYRNFQPWIYDGQVDEELAEHILTAIAIVGMIVFIIGLTTCFG